MQVCFDEDIEYDFRGHIRAGKISWLKNAWNYIPVSFAKCEDFWISAVLKSYYNMSTKSPKFPCPKGNIIVPDMLLAYYNSSINHVDASLGNLTIDPILELK